MKYLAFHPIVPAISRKYRRPPCGSAVQLPNFRSLLPRVAIGLVAGLSRCVRVFMFVVAWRSVKPIVAGGLILHSLRLPGEELHELGEDLGAVSAREAEGELGDEQAVRGAEVVPVAVDLEGQIPFAVGELRQCR